MITIETFRPEHLAQVQGLVNAHLGALLPGWAVPEALIASRLQRNPGEYVVAPWVIARTTIVAIEAQRVVAAAHLLRYGSSPEVSEFCTNIGTIDWIVAWPDAGEAAAELLAAAHQQFVVWGVREEWADVAMLVGPFAGVPDAWPHIAAALRAAGYQPDPGRDEMVYAGRIDQVPPPDAPPLAGLELQRTIGGFGTRFTATLEGQPVGHCECIADLTEGGAAPALRGWAELSEVEVEPSWQRRGIGTWLVRHATAWLRLGGCDRIALVVAVDAEAAGADRFYQRFGWGRLSRQQRGWGIQV